MEMMLLPVIILCLPLFYIWATYNSLVTKNNQVTQIFSTLDALLTKRFDLIPNLVATVQAYCKHEQNTLTELTALRSRAQSSSQLPESEKLALDGELGRSVKQVMLSVEAYPELKANHNFLQLQATLSELEEQLSAGRRAYSGAVTDYNNALETFPSNLVASFLHFEPVAVYQATESQKAVPQVSQLFGS